MLDQLLRRPAQRFVGPWQLFEVMEREFHAIDPTFPARDPAIPPWRFVAGDVLDLAQAERRADELKLVRSPAPGAAVPGAVDVSTTTLPTPAAGAQRVMDLFNSIIESWKPQALVDACAHFLRDESGRALRSAVPDPALYEEAQREDVRQRFNRQVLEAAFGGMLRAAGDRELQALLKRAREHEAPAPAGGAHPERGADDPRPLPSGRWALCLSGGGIRSATFSLGLLQELARADLLGRFDYLSTVSGGGYVGGWLSAWMQRDGRDPVLQALKSEARGPLMPEPAPVQHLRGYSNYLAPQKGLFSADTWTLVATVVRNLLLNWLVVLPVVAAVLMVPLFCLAVVGHAPAGDDLPVWLSILAAAGYVSASTGVWFVHTRRPGGFRREETKPASADGGSEAYDETRESSERTRATSPEPGERTDQKAFLAWCLLPIVVATALLATATAWASPDGGLGEVRMWPWTAGPIPEPWLALIPAAFGAAVHLTGWAFARVRRARRKFTEGLTILATGAMAGGLITLMVAVMSAASQALRSWTPHVTDDSVLWMLGRNKIVYAVMAFPTFFAAVVVAGFAFVGLASRRQDDEEREWSSRYSGWLMLAGIAWLAFSAVVIASTTLFSGAQAWLTGGGGVAAGLTAARLGKSPHTGSSKIVEAARKPAQTVARRYALALAAPVAVVLILLCLAALDQMLVGLFIRPRPVVALPGYGEWWHPGAVVAVLAVALFALGSVASHFVESNRFSLQAMYRARLIRAYLAASRPAGTRRPNAFTGFDPTDNLQMFQLGHTLTDADTPAAGWPGTPPPPDADVRPLRPFHVLNAALNVTGGTSLAWQDRQARSFTITALDAGANGLGYRRLSARGLGQGVFTQDAYYGGRFGMSLGTAVAISGAAASPNMGYHSSAPISFLMTLFNARLGGWMGNPGWAGKDTFHHASPRRVVAPIFLDLLGLATDGAPLVYLSDGGHFENLGVYEMVLRRCAVIVVADASCDQAFSFDDLGNAVRKVRVDLGISIDFGDDFRVEPPVGTGPGDGLHYAVASIGYGAVDGPGVPDGLLIYVKPTLNGDEGRDVLAYRKSSEAFPHEGTANQFFSEPQFESYRALGQHSGSAVVAGLTGRTVHAPAEAVHA